jgi:hypothetical protein
MTVGIITAHGCVKTGLSNDRHVEMAYPAELN